MIFNKEVKCKGVINIKLSVLFIIGAALSLLLCMALGVTDRVFPLGSIPAHSFLELTVVCLLFSIALSLFKNTKQ
jgi:hypothetical protein